VARKHSTAREFFTGNIRPSFVLDVDIGKVYYLIGDGVVVTPPSVRRTAVVNSSFRMEFRSNRNEITSSSLLFDPISVWLILIPSGTDAGRVGGSRNE
jgi:hypothetical protein